MSKYTLPQVNLNGTSIDLTPTWISAVPLLIYIAKYSDSPSALRDLTNELIKMAEAADMWNAQCKRQIAVLEQSAIATATAPQTAQQGGK